MFSCQRGWHVANAPQSDVFRIGEIAANGLMRRVLRVRGTEFITAPTRRPDPIVRTPRTRLRCSDRGMR
ncbi:hypothetical protein Thpro_021986 [Acidihalobacter prosperus]|uniref:Uncharacterized protein n=1 Tax=Acidihalobacter prosperus TaxID=160660 RepID=A0A1A6C522_9GAMM|nr:hypothetical protein Thpro_021986 [Acidihalobacter prosperus]